MLPCTYRSDWDDNKSIENIGEETGGTVDPTLKTDEEKRG
jgi:hypothetical protein